MTSAKTSRRALLSSVLATLLCVAMLIGTTFAWFTDTASTAVNKIQAGKLDIQLLAEDGVTSLEGDTLGWQAADGRDQEDILWEPGCTYNLQPIVIKNAGDLALKYKIAISGIKGSDKLNEAIEWTINGVTLDAEKPLLVGQSDTLTISGHMKETAGNEYQGLSIEAVGITVFATQYTSEYDSENNTYDATAEYDTVALTAAELAAVMVPGADGVINLTKNYIVTDAWTSLTLGASTVTIKGNNHTISGINKPLLVGNAATNLTVKDLTINNSNIGIAANENGLATGAFISYMDATASATFENCHLVNSVVTGNERAAAFVGYATCATLTIKDCSVEDCTIKAYGGTGAFTAYTQATTTVTNSVVKNTSVTSTEDRLGTKTPLAGGAIGTIGGTTTFTGVSATNVTVYNNNATAVHSTLIGRVTGSGTITIN